MNNLRHEKSSIVLKDKVMNQTTTCKNAINELKNENFIKENKIIIMNHLNETKNNFRTTVTTNGPSTSYSSKGFYNGSPEMKKSLIGFCKKKFPDGKYFLYCIIYFLYCVIYLLIFYLVLPHLNKSVQKQIKHKI